MRPESCSARPEQVHLFRCELFQLHPVVWRRDAIDAPQISRKNFGLEKDGNLKLYSPTAFKSRGLFASITLFPLL